MSRIIHCFLVANVVTLFAGVSAEDIVFEDFDHWDASGWELYGTSRVAAESGDLLLRSAGGGYVSVVFDEVIWGDVSLRTQVRVIEGQIGLVTKSQLVGYDAHYLFFTPDGGIGLHASVDEQATRYEGTDVAPMAGLEQDFIIQLDSVDGILDTWVWPAGSAAPAAPQSSIQLEDRHLLDRGRAGVYVGGVLFPERFEVIFRYIEIADSPIPIPVSPGLSSGTRN